MSDPALAWISALSFPILLLVTSYLLYAYAVPSTPMAMKITVCACWFMGFAGTLLLPIDMGYALFYGVDAGLKGVWLFLFWATFVAAWVVTPVMMEYWAAGDFTQKDRLRTSIRVNVRFYLALLIISFILLIVILIIEHFSFSAVAALVIAASDAYGLLIIIALLGYGFVELPRALWLRSFPDRELRGIRFRAAVVDENLYSQQVELVETAAAVAAACRFVRDHNSHNRHLVECAAVLEQETPEDVSDVHQPSPSSASNAASSFTTSGAGADASVETLSQADDAGRERVLAQLRHKLRSRVLARERARNRWAQIVQQAEVLEVVLSGTPPQVRPSFSASPAERLHALWLTLWWRYRVHADAVVCRCAAVLAAAMSLVLLWCECTIALPAKLSPWGAAVEGASTGAGVFFAAGIPLVYLSVCTYRSFFRVRLPMLLTIGIFPNQHTDAYSLLLSACYLSRLQFALCYNFLLLLQLGPDGSAGISGTAWLSSTASFSAVVGSMDVVPFLGDTFNRIFPALSLVVFFLTLFNVCGRVFKWLGVEELEPYSAGNDEHQQRIDHGRRILDRARARETASATASLPAGLRMLRDVEGDTASAALQSATLATYAKPKAKPARAADTQRYEPPSRADDFPTTSTKPSDARRPDFFSSM